MSRDRLVSRDISVSWQSVTWCYVTLWCNVQRETTTKCHICVTLVSRDTLGVSWHACLCVIWFYVVMCYKTWQESITWHGCVTWHKRDRWPQHVTWHCGEIHRTRWESDVVSSRFCPHCTMTSLSTLHIHNSSNYCRLSIAMTHYKELL